MIRTNKHGIKEYEDEFEEVMIYFNDWLINYSSYSQSWESITSDLICKDYSEDYILELQEELEEQFYDYCDANGYIGEIV